MSKSWNQTHPEECRQAVRRYRARHPERVKELAKRHRQNRRDKARAELLRYATENKEKEKARRRRYRDTHKSHLKADANRRYRTNWNHRLAAVLRARLNGSLNGRRKAAHTQTLVGCSLAELVAHIEQRFAPGMSWANYGYRGWHIDHVRPCASFDLRVPSQQRRCFHYTNLQPLWAADNLRKGSRPAAEEYDPLRWGLGGKR